MSTRRTTPRCSHCREDLVVDETIDIEVYEEEVWVEVYGHCEQCGAEYQWEQIFTISSFDSFREVNL